VQWRTTVVVEEAAVPPVGAATLTLVDPLPPGADLAPVDWVRPVRDGSDRVVAISLDRLAWDNPRDGTLRVELAWREPIAEGKVLLHPPLFVTDAAQRVDLASPEGLRFTPEHGSGIEQRLGHAASARLSGERVRQCERLLPAHGAASFRAYLLAGPALGAGLPGELETKPLEPGMIFALGAVFTLGLGLLLAGYRAVGRKANRDRDEAVLAQELSGMRAAARRRKPGPGPA
jgi:hypothetical protein